MRPLILARLGLLAVLPAALFLTACGGSDSKKVDADDWVSDLCDIAIDFDKAGDEAGEDFLESDLDDTKEAKEAFADALKGQREAQKDFRSDFKKLGTPDIEDGDKVVEAFEKQFDDNDEYTDEIADAIEDIDDDDDFMLGFLAALDDNPEPDFRETLEDIAGDGDDVQDLIASIEDDEDCADVIFDDEEVSTSDSATATRATGTQAARPTASITTPAPGASTNEQWVSGICKGFSGWVLDIEKANQTLQQSLPTATTPVALKKVLVDFMKSGQAETRNLQKEIAALKPPSVNQGPAIHKVFTDASADLVKTFDGFVSDAEKVGTASLAQVTADVTALSAKIGTAFDGVSQSFDKLDQFNAPQLEQMFKNKAECAGLS